MVDLMVNIAVLALFVGAIWGTCRTEKGWRRIADDMKDGGDTMKTLAVSAREERDREH